MANPGHTFHNRFANDETITTGKDEEVKDFGFEFKEFSEFSPTLDAAGPFTVQNDKHSESSHVISSAESYTQLAKPEPSHVNALEAAVEQQDDTDNAGTSSAAIEAPQKEEAPPNSTFASPSVPVLSSMSSFQQALDGVGSRSTLPRPPVIDTNVSGSNQPSAALAAASPYSINGLSSAVNTMDMNGRGGRTPESGDHAQVPRPRKTEEATISRPSSFFGLDKAFSGIDDLEHDPAAFPERPADDVPSVLNGLDGAESIATRGRRSSFFGMEQPMGHVPDPDRPSEVPSQAARIAASHRNAELVASTDYHNNSGPQSLADSGHNTGASGSNGATRPGSIAGTISSGPLLDHSHLKPGLQASLLSHNKTLELYRHNAKKTNDPNLIYEFAVFMVDASKNMGGDGSSGGSGAAGTDYTGKEEHDRDEVGREATGLLKKIAERGHMDAQYFLADCYANGIGTPKGKQDFDKAYPLFVLAAKHGHPDAAYRAGTCYEKGWGCRKDVAKALQFYRKAASQTHPGAMYRLATAELNGELGLKKSAREGVKWLKRSAESATPEFPHALHELALLHERGVDNVLFVDEEYSCELLAQAAEMGYAPSAYKLGVNYEYGRMGCPQDGGLSIHMYNIAAQQNHKEACFALTAWYLVGAPGILPQSDTEAYLWAKKAAEQGLAKAEYAVGYFTEMGIGTVRDIAESRAWYRAAAEHGDKRANQRLTALGGQPVPMANEASGTDSKDNKRDSVMPPQAQPGPPRPQQQQQQQAQRPVSGPGAPPTNNRPQMRLSAAEQGQRAAAEHAQRMAAQAEQNRIQNQQLLQQAQNNPSHPERFSMPPNGVAGSAYGAPLPRPMPMRESLPALPRDAAFHMGGPPPQHQHQSRGPPPSISSASSYRPPMGSEANYTQHQRPMAPSIAPSSQYTPSVYSTRQGSGPPPSNHRPPQGRQGSMPVPYAPSRADYPSYPSHMSAADSYNFPAPTRHDSPDPISHPTNNEKAEKKKSLWSQIKEI